MVWRNISRNFMKFSSSLRSTCSIMKRLKCQVTPRGIIRWQSYSTAVLVEGMITPSLARWPM